MILRVTKQVRTSAIARLGHSAGRCIRRGMRARRLSVGGSFLLSLLGVGLVMLGIAGVGLAGLRASHDQTGDALSHFEDASDRVALQTALDAVARAALEQTAGVGPDETTRIETRLDEVLLPEVDDALIVVRADAGDQPGVSVHLDLIDAGLARYQQLRSSGAYDMTPDESQLAEQLTAVVQSNTLAITTAVLFEETARHAEAVVNAEAGDVQRAQVSADTTYRSTRTVLVAAVALALLAGAVVIALAIRNVVPRIRDYSRFATEIATGQATGSLVPRGDDELGDLGRALSGMVAIAQGREQADEAQAEYVDALQVSATEEEAHELVQRHLERAVPGSEVVILQRNNSANRLRSATSLADDSVLVQRLAGAEPRACLALRFGRTHHEGGDRAPLLSCALCAAAGTQSSCEPLLVGGEVIGSVLTKHTAALSAAQAKRIKTSVVQAAPVLANLRNLSLAEFRANNDSLTGLPNKRATEDTLKRMVAQANRSITPLAAVMVDLDHFKQVNDTFGHAKGDEVLAAVGAALLSTLRASDFAGRFGGEEFLLLLPETDLDGAYQVAEKVREAIATTTVPGVDRPITASLGIADLLRHAGNSDRLLREADRALYAAKSAGRNRTLIVATDGVSTGSGASV